MLVREAREGGRVEKKEKGIGHGVMKVDDHGDPQTARLRQWPDQHSDPIPGSYKFARSAGFGSLASQGRAAGK